MLKELKVPHSERNNKVGNWLLSDWKYGLSIIGYLYAVGSGLVSFVVYQHNSRTVPTYAFIVISVGTSLVFASQTLLSAFVIYRMAGQSTKQSEKIASLESKVSEKTAALSARAEATQHADRAMGLLAETRIGFGDVILGLSEGHAQLLSIGDPISEIERQQSLQKLQQAISAQCQKICMSAASVFSARKSVQVTDIQVNFFRLSKRDEPLSYFILHHQNTLRARLDMEFSGRNTALLDSNPLFDRVLKGPERVFPDVRQQIQLSLDSMDSGRFNSNFLRMPGFVKSCIVMPVVGAQIDGGKHLFESQNYYWHDKGESSIFGFLTIESSKIIFDSREDEHIMSELAISMFTAWKRAGEVERILNLNPKI